MAAKEPTPEDIKASYGFVAMLADSIPEIANLLQQAVSQSWTPDRFVMSVANTNWWKTTGSGARDWIIKSITDPANAKRESEAGAWEIRRFATEMGLPVTSEEPYGPEYERFRQIWIQSKLQQVQPEAMVGWLFPQLVQGVSNERAVDTAGGRYGQLIGEMFQLAHDFGYAAKDPDALTDEIIGEANKIMLGGGSAGATAWRSKMSDYAQANYAPYADAIKGGKTVSEIARPIVDRVSDLLEVAPESMSLRDPLMKKALTEWGAENRPLSLNEIENFARQDARWKTTDNAMENSVKLLNEIGQTFGFLGNR
jgi:hypothetical protein